VLTSLTHRHPLSSASPFATGFRLFRSWIATLAREIEIRRDIRRLAAFDDGMLHDVGLSRSGIEDAVRHGRARASRGWAAAETQAPAVDFPSSAWTEWR
jgi:uncharacterized protein YjiS (DUF1127 family)